MNYQKKTKNATKSVKNQSWSHPKKEPKVPFEPPTPMRKEPLVPFEPPTPMNWFFAVLIKFHMTKKGT